jgi:hypothetical protein
VKLPIWITELSILFALLWGLGHYDTALVNNVPTRARAADTVHRFQKHFGEYARNGAFWRGLKRAEEDADLQRRSTRLSGAAESIPLAEMVGVLDTLSCHTTAAAVELTQLLVRQWAEANASEAAAWAARLPESPSRRNALNQVAIIWAKTDLSAAAAWLKGLAEGPDKDSAMVSLAYEAARTEPALAIELAGELPPSSERDELLAHSVSQWASISPDLSLDWVMRIVDAPLRDHLLDAVAVALAWKDGFRAATLISGSLAQDEWQLRSAVAVVQRWAEQSPQAAASWVVRFTESQVQDDATRNLVSVWAKSDYGAAQAWVQGLPEGRLRNVATSALPASLGGGHVGGVGLIDQRESLVP